MPDDPLEDALREATFAETSAMSGPPDSLRQRLDVLRRAFSPDTQFKSVTSLQIADPAHAPGAFALTSATTVGTAPKNAICLTGQFISRKHCSLRPIDGQWLIEDNDSTNGLYVNGERVTSRFLCDGDIVQVGNVPMVFLKGEQGASGPSGTLPLDEGS
ncbi:MAG: FHA domain-containing protein [Lentisphaerae bacterium]|jgi:hypothetical protein|nr:FHA domain-containing protein [Lentisphaerota bacterium]MBT4814505.1 FHA domain-containing protein [Lentisphaerota bacterium]MBT5605210.1 FHA domain-containing protein [Lentisphaerota bacterium]MBT7054338.1 FHA domain-containing protein [Lentisphaerota bacterium]MBT7844878.1 FHA domain-containing protein [Lentisphaerota bacterium]